MEEDISKYRIKSDSEDREAYRVMVPGKGSDSLTGRFYPSEKRLLSFIVTLSGKKEESIDEKVLTDLIDFKFQDSAICVDEILLMLAERKLKAKARPKTFSAKQ